MNVRTKLRGAFALYIALLAGLSLFHVRTIRRTVESARELAKIASRLRSTSTVQLERIAQIGSDVDKYAVRADTDYLRRARQTASEFDTELRRLQDLPLNAEERSLLPPLTAAWDSTLQLANTLEAHHDSASVERFQDVLVSVHSATQTLSAASQDAMTAELVASERAERAAEDVTLMTAGGAVLLSVLLSALLARSILSPLNQLAEGTREVSAGRFGHRLTPSGNDELAKVAREFNAMTERLDELDRMKREFVSKVSHDLKTPLSSMQETNSVLLDEVPGPLTPKQRKLLEITQDSAQRLSTMLNKLLDISRLEAGVQTEYKLIDVRPLMRRSVERVAETGTTNRVVLATSDTPPRLLVRGNADDLAQVFDNLLENALKFSPFDGQVHVTVSEVASRGDVLVTVADEGPGIPDEEKKRVFERFYQTEAGRGVRARGVGLGLSICQEIAAAHGGAIWVTDNQPRGSIFHVLLPGVNGT